MVLEHFPEGHLDGEDDQLHHFDRVFAGLIGVVDRVVEDQFDDRVPALILNQTVDLVDPLGEHVVAQIEALAHLAVLRAETGQHPHRAVAHRSVRAEYQRAALALGDRPQALDRLIVIVGHHHRAGAAVVAPRERAADRLQRAGPTFRAVDPVGQLGGGSPLTRGQESGNSQRHNQFGWIVKIRRGHFLPCDCQQSQRLVGEAGKLGLGIGVVSGDLSVRVEVGRFVIGEDLAVLVDPHAADIDRVGLRGIRLCGFGFGLRFGLEQILRQHLAQHQVRVGAAEPEAGHPGDGVAAVAGPIGGGVGDLEVHSVEVDVRVGPGVVDRRWNLVVPQRQSDLRQAGRTGRRLQVTDVGLDRTQQCGLISGPTPADDAAQRVGLDRVAEDGAGAVRLDVVDGARVDTGVVVGPAQHIGLGIRVRGQHPV